jgi:thiol:disulfide interchange protein DsbD
MTNCISRPPSPLRATGVAWVVLLLAFIAFRADAKFLEPDQAFRFSANVDGDAVVVRYAIADGYYLYRERFKFALDSATAAGAVLGQPVFPKGEIKYDETFAKDVETYRHEVVVRIPIAGAAGPVTLLSTSQGCADAGLCYPPQVARATLTPVGVASSRNEAATPAKPLDDASRIERTLKSGNAVLIALLFVALGVLLAFTPCVLPMVPILSSIIVGQANATIPASRLRGFVLAAVYSLGMALVYTLLGIAAGLAGEGLAAALQTPLILSAFAALLVVLSLSMFGFYELQVPTGMQTRLARWSGRAGTSTGRWIGAFAMGALSALIVGPCVAAPLAGALVYIGQTRDVFIGGLALFCLAIGMSVPLLLVGLSAGALLPRAGAWMDTVKHFFGVLLIGVALWMVTPVLPTRIVMLAWAVIAIVAAVFMRVFDPLPPGAPGFARLGKGIGAVLLLAGAVELVGAATGGGDVLEPLAHRARGSDGVAVNAPRGAQLPFEMVKGTADLDRRIATAANDGRPVLLDFYADWCVSCKEMERFTYSDARVAQRMRDFVLLKADVTGNDADDRAMLKRFQLFGPPGIVFFDRDGKPLTDASVIGFQDADRFLTSLGAAVPGTKS